jgi:hypothetical protein
MITFRYYDDGHKVKHISDDEKVCLTCKYYYLDTGWTKEGTHRCKALSIKYLEPSTFYCSKYIKKG